ncbi:MAG: hypothetical protein GY716_02800 [bacterium]|nr:hypothetical protein [bacterium]
MQVASNGQININSTDGNSNCCTADPVVIGGNYTKPRIALAQEDLDQAFAGDVWFQDTGTSVIISFESVAFFNDTGEANAQAELFDDGTIELRYDFFNAGVNTIAGGVEDDTRTPASATPNVGGNWSPTGISPDPDALIGTCVRFTLDTDGDGDLNLTDPDDDNDGVADGQDSAPLDPRVCQDLDADGCDDCSQNPTSTSTPTPPPWPTYTPSITDDGADTDGDGLCDAGDSDDDNDGIGDADDVNPTDPNACRDLDDDTCDDCSVLVDGFGPLSDSDPGNDGLDSDGDGICDAGDTDNDNDGVDDVDDADPLDPNVCRDLDVDTCDDCTLTGADQSGGDPSDDGTDADADGLCDAGDRLDFSVAQLQFGFPMLYPQNVYHDDPPGPGGITQPFPTQLPGSTNLDALDVTGPDEYKFSVTSPAYVFAPGGPVFLSPANVYMRDAGGAITVDLDWSAEGINLQSLNALDMVDADTYLFSVGAPQVVVDGTGASRVLYPSGVYRFDRGTGAIDEVLDATGLGMADVNGVDLLPDGRIALSPAAQGIAPLPGGAMIVHPARAYITDLDAPGPSLVEAYDGPSARLLRIDGFTMIVPEAP